MRVLLLVLFLDLVGAGVIFATLPFLALDLGATPQQVTWLIATLPLTQLVAAPFWGLVSDRGGRRPVLLIGFTSAIVSLLLIAVASQLWVLFLARAMLGLLTANVPAGQGYVADITTVTDRARGMAFVGAALALGFIAGNALVAVAGGDIDGGRTARLLLAAPVLPLAASLLTVFVLREPLTRAQRVAHLDAAAPGPRRSANLKGLSLLVTLLFLIGTVVASIEGTLALWSETVLGWGPQQFGAILAFAGLVAVLVQALAVGPLVRRIGEPQLLRPSLVLIGAGLLVIPLANSGTMLFVAMGLIAAGLGLSNPVLQSLMTQNSRADLAGSAIGVGESAYNLARVAGPVWAGFLFAEVGRDWPFLASAVIVGVLLVLAGPVQARISPHAATGPAD